MCGDETAQLKNHPRTWDIGLAGYAAWPPRGVRTAPSSSSDPSKESSKHSDNLPWLEYIVWSETTNHKGQVIQGSWTIIRQPCTKFRPATLPRRNNFISRSGSPSVLLRLPWDRWGSSWSETRETHPKIKTPSLPPDFLYDGPLWDGRHILNII